VLEPPRPVPGEFGKGQGPPASCRRLGEGGSPRAGGWGGTRSSNEAQEVGETPDGDPGGGLAAAVRAGGRGGARGRHDVRLVERQGEEPWCWCWCRWRTTDGKCGGEATGNGDEE
jgi:hypothetical protein